MFFELRPSAPYMHVCILRRARVYHPGDFALNFSVMNSTLNSVRANINDDVYTLAALVPRDGRVHFFADTTGVQFIKCASLCRVVTCALRERGQLLFFLHTIKRRVTKS